jgi:hypothetical protein
MTRLDVSRSQLAARCISRGEIEMKSLDRYI